MADSLTLGDGTRELIEKYRSLHGSLKQALTGFFSKSADGEQLGDVIMKLLSAKLDIDNFSALRCADTIRLVGEHRSSISDENWSRIAQYIEDIVFNIVPPTCREDGSGDRNSQSLYENVLENYKAVFGEASMGIIEKFTLLAADMSNRIGLLDKYRDKSTDVWSVDDRRAIDAALVGTGITVDNNEQLLKSISVFRQCKQAYDNRIVQQRDYGRCNYKAWLRKQAEFVVRHVCGSHPLNIRKILGELDYGYNLSVDIVDATLEVLLSEKSKFVNDTDTLFAWMCNSRYRYIHHGVRCGFRTASRIPLDEVFGQKKPPTENVRAQLKEILAEIEGKLALKESTILMDISTPTWESDRYRLPPSKPVNFVDGDDPRLMIDRDDLVPILDDLKAEVVGVLERLDGAEL
jgi:hypothetical protein